MFFLTALLSTGLGSFLLIHLRHQHSVLPQTRTLQPSPAGVNGGSANVQAADEPLKLVGTSPSGNTPQLPPKQLEPAAGAQSSGCARTLHARKSRLSRNRRSPARENSSFRCRTPFLCLAAPGDALRLA